MMQYRPVIVRIHKARAMMTMLNTLNSAEDKTGVILRRNTERSFNHSVRFY